MQTRKVKFKDILKTGVNYTQLYDCIKRADDILTRASYFIYMYVISEFLKSVNASSSNYPRLNDDFIRMVLKAISKDAKGRGGRKPEGDNKIIYKNVCSYYKDVFVKAFNCDNNDKFNIDALNLSNVFKEHANDMETYYRVHVEQNFENHVKHYVNQLLITSDFKKISNDEFEALTSSERQKYIDKKRVEKDRLTAIKKEVAKVKDDLLENRQPDDFKSAKHYHSWILENKPIIFPTLESDMTTFREDIKINSDKYRFHMLKMNKKLEENNKILSACIPLRKETTTMHISFNTSAIQEVFNDRKTPKAELWSKYFNITNNMGFDGYTFNDNISTNLYDVSINYISGKGSILKQKKIASAKKGRDETNKKNKQMKDTLDNEYKTYKNEQKTIYKNKKSMTKNKQEKIALDEELKKILLEKQTDIKKRFDDFKKQNKDEKAKSDLDKQKQKVKKPKTIKKQLTAEEKLKIRLTKDVVYIEDAVKDETMFKFLKNAYDNNKIKVIDAGERDLLNILGSGKQYEIHHKKTSQNIIKKDNDDTIEQDPKDILEQQTKLITKQIIGQKRGEQILYSYRSRRRLRNTKRLKRQKLLKNKKSRRQTLVNLEKELSEYNHKTLNIENIIKYIKIKMNMRNIIKSEEGTNVNYAKDLKYKWHSYENYAKKLKWYSYIDNKREDEALIREIRKIYGEDCVLVIGDWHMKGKTHRIKMPNMRLFRLLQKHFTVFIIDEYKTSKINHITDTEHHHQKVKVVYQNKETQKITTFIKELHAVYTFKTGKGKEMCKINRDYNATMNMFKILKCLLETKERPVAFRRKSDPTIVDVLVVEQNQIA